MSQLGAGYRLDVRLLDQYPGAAAAYSLRKLRSGYTGPCVRVRRSSDNAETDIGFAGGTLDTAALLSFVGAGDGFVRAWHDQSGQGRDAVNGKAAQQPKIVDNGSVLTHAGKPALDFNGGQILKSPFALNESASSWTAFAVGRHRKDNTGVVLQGGRSFLINQSDGILESNIGGSGLDDGDASVSWIAATWWDLSAGELRIYRGGTQANSISTTEDSTSSDMNIGAPNPSSAQMYGFINEVVVWASARSDVVKISDSINEKYGTY